MKPSEIIWKKYEYFRGRGGDDAMRYCEAIVEFIDEEYEKNNAVRCSSSVVLTSYPAQYNCDTCGNHWTSDDETPICKGTPNLK